MNIQAISYYYPDTCLDNEELALQNPEWPVDKIAAKTGIYKRPIASETTLSSDLAYEAAKKLFNSNGIAKERIDFLLFCTQSPDYFLPTTACLLQERLGLSHSIGALDFNLGCSGYIYGLSLAKGLVCSHTAKCILLLTGETYSKFVHQRDKSSKTLFGDAASATIISDEKGLAEIGNFCLGTDGSGADNLIVKNGGFRHRNRTGNDIFDNEKNFVRNDNFLYMNGNEIFQFTLRSVPVLIQETLDKHGLNMEDIDLFVFHQANQFMLKSIRKALSISEDRFYINLGSIGNTVSATIPIALKDAMEAGKIKQNMKVLIAGFGVGYSYGATILQF
jgi:3-oxoacyl-[acyl-carrier-protein] synthase-3